MTYNINDDEIVRIDNINNGEYYFKLSSPLYKKITGKEQLHQNETYF